MSRRDAVQSKHDTQYSAGYDELIAKNPPQVKWRLNSRGIWVHVSVVDPTAERALMTHCKNSHEWTEKSTAYDPDGHRICRPCKAEAQRRRTGAKPRKPSLKAMEAEAAEVAERFRQHHADNTSLMRAVRREI
jgi:hypothetical protein